MDEVQRYARFVQFKQTLTGAQDYLLVGVDVKIKIEGHHTYCWKLV